jgi:hypothetical protein
MMNSNVTQDTLNATKAAISTGLSGAGQGSENSLQKNLSTLSNIYGFDLQAPAKNLYPVLTPVRNLIPREFDGFGTATNWKVITNLLGSAYLADAGIPEGQRAGLMNYTAVNRTASYVSIGEDDQVTFEGVSSSRTYEDILATAAMRVLQQLMLKEESMLLFGNNSVPLGTTPTPTTTSTVFAASTLPAATYSVICVALTGAGIRNSTVANGMATALTVTGADGLTFTKSGGSAIKSAAAAQVVAVGERLSATVAIVNGAMGYAWFVGAAGAERLQSITTINSAVFASPLNAVSQLAATVNLVDRSIDQYQFDGLHTHAFRPGSGAYIKSLATGVPGLGSPLTSSGTGSCVEVDDMLQAMWEQSQVAPSILLMNAAQLRALNKVCLTSSGGSALIQVQVPPGAGGESIQAGHTIATYTTPFVASGVERIRIVLHPNVPAGTILAWSPTLPLQYQSNGVSNVAIVKGRRDYHSILWTPITRKYPMGCYAEQTLVVYAPFALGAITNIGFTPL